MNHAAGLGILAVLVVTASASAQDDVARQKKLVVDTCAKSGIEARLDQPYAGNENDRQRVDLYLPLKRKNNRPLPVIAYIHGGGWNQGDRLQYSSVVQLLVRGGDFAAVSVGYRLTDEARWPAQIHDCKAAIRWIRGHAGEFHLDPDRIGVLGASAGGHLASLLGTSGDVKELEGSLGEFTALSSRVTCVANQCGPQDLTKGLMLDRNGQPVAKNPMITGLLGGTFVEKPKVALAASPLTYITPDDPPFLTLHGTADPVVHFSSHAKALHAALQKAGVSSRLITILGGDHASPAKAEPTARALQFFDKYLRDVDVSIDVSPIQVK